MKLYYGLRDYGTDPLVWGGDPEHEHEWSHGVKAAQHWGKVVPGTLAGTPNVVVPSTTHAFCPCGAWLGSLGLEPTPEMFIEHLVEVFREVRRVLRPDGTVWVNLGDSYAGSGKGPSGSNGIGEHFRKGVDSLSLNAEKYQGQKPGAVVGLKAKDLMMMPARLAMALQADGWWLRSQIPWLKRNSMPESVTDRPATAVEYVYLLSKSSRYYWDADAVRVANSAGSFERYKPGEKIPTFNKSGGSDRANASFKNGQVFDATGRNWRNADFFFQTWQGLLLDEQDEPLALVVNPQPFKGSHFATFPVNLVEPMVKASTSEKGQCPECGAPWVRQREATPEYQAKLERGRQSTAWKLSRRADAINVGVAFGDKPEDGSAEYITVGWRPSCAHGAPPVPQTVLDCFGGAGTVGLVADRLGRNAVLVDLKDSYAGMAADRLTGDAPMFVELEGAGPVRSDVVDDKQGALGKRTYSGFNARWDAKEKAL